MNFQCRRLQELMLYELHLDYNGAIDHNIVTRGLKKFHKGCKNHDDLTRLGGPKIMDSDTIATNSVSSSQRISGELGISLSSIVRHLHDLDKCIWIYKILPHVTKIL